MIARKHGGGRKFGVRHLQLIFACMHSVLDGIGIFGLMLYMHEARKVNVPGSQGEERLFSKSEVQQVEGGIFLTSAITRLLSPYVVLTLNNKYQGIALALLEAVIYACLLSTCKVLKFYGIVALCLLLTMCQSIRLSLALNMIAKWIPPREHTRAIAVVQTGAFFGRSLVVYLIMIEHFKLNFFYVLACLKGAHTVAYFFFGAQDPQTCWILRKSEWHYLCKEIGYRRKIECNWKIPWRNIFRTRMIYGLMCSAIAAKWFYVDFVHFNYFVPGREYRDAVNIAIMIYPLVLFGIAWGIDVMIYKDIVTRNNLRKICSCFVFWGNAIAICFMCFYSKEPNKVVAYFIVATYFGLGYIVSEIPTIFDMSPNYAVELHVIYTFPAWIFAAIKISILDPDYPLPGDYPFKDNLNSWYITAFLSFTLNYGFLMFGDVGWCQFDTFNAVDWRKESQISYP